MNDIIIKTLWTSVAAIVYISQLVSQTTEYADIFSSAENKTAATQDRRQESTGQPDGTSTGQPPGPIWWPSRGETNLINQLLLKSVKLAAILFLTYIGYIISNKIKSKFGNHSVEVKVKVENEFKTDSGLVRDRFDTPEFHYKLLE